ncbi:MAG TPA: hypothetical protein VMK84_15015, partial [Streptosporangiaceae bacterium]|nr:hypothetical protein [Streptosporangiaceae bacterium]
PTPKTGQAGKGTGPDMGSWITQAGQPANHPNGRACHHLAQPASRFRRAGRASLPARRLPTPIRP